MIIDRYHLHEDAPEKIPFSIYALDQYLQANAINTIRPHIHSFYQIIWFTNGEGQHFVDFNGYPVKKDTIFFIAKDQIHNFDSPKGYDGILFHFNESFLIQNSPDMGMIFKYNIFNNYGSAPSMYITENQRPSLLHLSQLMIEELAHPQQFASEDLLIYLLKSFLILSERIHRNVSKEEGTFKVTNDKHMQFLQFRELLEKFYKRGIAIGDYARKMNVTSKTLREVTKQVAKKTPSHMLHERVILEAKRLLAHSSFSIQEIGYELNFDDPSYFAKYFKKYSKMSPGQFRLFHSG